MPDSTLYILVPVYNEAENLGDLIRSFRNIDEEFRDRYALHFILIDDGSSDNTGAIARQMADGINLSVLTHERNMGPGRAYATGFEHLYGTIRDNDWLVTMEGDNTSRLEILNQMFVRSREGFDVVLASCYIYGAGMINTPPHRVFTSQAAVVFVHFFLGLHGFITTSLFFRLFRGSAIRKLYSYYGPQIVDSPGFECMVEILLKMVYLNISASEVPMLLDTSKRKGKSKMKIIRTILRYFSIVYRKKKWKMMASGAGTGNPEAHI